MAFTGTPTVKRVSDRIWRITGVSLDADASGTIGLIAPDGPDPDIILGGNETGCPTWQPYRSVGDLGGDGIVSLQDAIEVTMGVTTDVGAAVPISVVKSGTTTADFLITMHNDNAALGQASGVLEIYIKYH